MQRALYPKTVFTLCLLLLTGATFATSDSLKTKRYTVNPVPDVKKVYHASVDDPNFKHGKYQLFYRGRLLLEGFYNENQKQGEWNRLYPSGKVNVKGFYVNNKKHKDWTYDFEDGTETIRMSFVLNRKNGTWKSYFRDGSPCSLIDYKNDKVDGRYVVYHPNGKLAQNTFISYTDSNLLVSSLKFYDNGKLYEEAYQYNNLLDSIYARYHKNGLIWEKFRYNEGQLIDVLTMKNQQGVNLKKGSFENGYGELNFYHSNGYKHSSVHFRDGKRSGKALFYYRKLLQMEGVYVKNRRIGTWKFYSKYGKLKTERNYYDGQDLIWERNFYGGGSEGSEGELLNGLRDGIWKEYNFYGEVIEETPYKLGFKHGQAKTYDAGTVRESGGFYYGERVGEWRYYNRGGKVTYKQNYVKEVKFNPDLVEGEEIAPIPDQQNEFNYETPSSEASFIGGNSMELNFYFTHMKYPDQAKAHEMQGKVIVMFKVSELGEIHDIRILRGIGLGCDEEVIRVLESMPPWEPAMLNGFPVETEVVRIIPFEDRT